MESEEASDSSSEGSSSDDSFIFDSEENFNDLLERETEQGENCGEDIRDVFKINRSVNRTDYSRSKKRLKSTDPWSTNFWLQTLADPTIKDPFSRTGKKFRRDFRISHIIFEEILTMLRQTGEKAFNYSEVIIGGKPSIPLSLKVLCALRTLGSGLKFKDAAEISGYMSETTANKFFRDFNRLFRLHFADIYLNRLSGADLQTSMLQYSMLGLPGCVGSIDATFVPWDACSANLTNLCSGDKGV